MKSKDPSHITGPFLCSETLPRIGRVILLRLDNSFLTGYYACDKTWRLIVDCAMYGVVIDMTYYKNAEWFTLFNDN